MRGSCRKIDRVRALLAAAALLVVLSTRPLAAAASSGADCVLGHLSQGLEHGLTLAHLTSEIASRRARVPEFEFIRKEAENRGMRVWLFGGTAAGYSHYVKWDLLRESGDLRFQKTRFDYDYTNIYRSTQDLDIVVDGSAQQAKEFQQSLKTKFPYFVGSKATPWEVRSLKEASHDKGAILDDFGFMNQHTDSNSTGMVELTNPPHHESIVRDLRDWKSAQDSRFLKDVYEDKLTYYFSPTHEQTPRAKTGQNPPVFSVIRALTKAFQYELKIRPEDLSVMKKEIEKFDPARDLQNPDTQRWLEKNGKKLFQHAINIEYAWNTLEELGLRKKLIGIRNNPNDQGSLSWWMSKEPLRTGPLGNGSGKTAKELGLDIVAHETNDFLAYESITRAHTGEPNVLISRKNTSGEAAMYGDGFYTAIGKKGARGTGITIRFKVDPNALEGKDFIRVGNYVIWQNRNAIQVIPESIEMSPLQYFEFLERGQNISEDDKALMWKFSRKFGNLFASNHGSREEMSKIRLLVLKKMRSKAPNRELLFGEWIRFEASRVGIPSETLSEARKVFRVDPVLLSDMIKKITQGTELQNWMDLGFFPHLMAKLKPDIGEGVLQRALYSGDPALREFGLQALKYAEATRPSPLIRALRKRVSFKKSNDLEDRKTIETWFKSVSKGSSESREEDAEEKAAFLLSQLGSQHSNALPSYSELSKLVSEREGIEWALRKNTNFLLFEKLAKQRDVEKNLYRSAKPESFQFKAFHFPEGGQKFEMGRRLEGYWSVDANEYSRELPHCEVTLTKPFEMQVTSVTELQWALVMGEDISILKNGGNLPAVNKSWEDAQRLIQRLNELDSHFTYRLPTEAEREFATRAGTTTEYSFGDGFTGLSDYAWYSENSGAQVHTVAELKPNSVGLHDMHGNVWEWVQDWYDAERWKFRRGSFGWPVWSEITLVDPTGPLTGSRRVVRGGSWADHAWVSNSARLSASPPETGSSSIGFRLVRTPRVPQAE